MQNMEDLVKIGYFSVFFNLFRGGGGGRRYIVFSENLGGPELCIRRPRD